MKDVYSSRLPDDPHSYWIDSTSFDEPRPLTESTETEVVVAGGGITGITAAWLLAKEGLDVILVDADKVLHGTTGHTTAKVTSQHGLFYHELIQHTDENHARLYYEGHEKAKNFIEKVVTDYQIPCEWEKQDAILYASSKKSAHQLQQEREAYDKLGIPYDVLDSLPFNVPIESALAMKNQAQFHPLHYLAFLLQDFKKMGGKVYEDTVVTGLVEGDTPIVETRDGPYISCRYVLSCTHFPFYEADNYFFARMYAERAYIVAMKGKKVNGMYLSVDNPSRSVRSVKINGEDHLLIAGDGHKTGQGEPTMNHYLNLETFAKDVFGAKEFPYRWSAQDLYTIDKIPYIGLLTAHWPNTFVATGFKKWGMTSGTLAALMLRDYVTGRETEEMTVFDPNRFLADPSLKTFLKQNLDVAKHFFVDKVKPVEKKIDEVKAGEGAIVLAEGRRSGAYRDENGKLFIVDSTCTHLGCEVEWNNGDRTWDCPCHGSRFNYDGSVAEGPAEKPLDRIE
ncbi:FAD-dependent oxidoreductase [Salipaludibacillus aurantiacus]|uniref:Glycine/D-amino acid oxidase n=1 Tax=Salipaludibacillus aurantiacus TaxID=1601833 RepID=A0A1H9V9H9_9BACI|nr:FAD-dependent oxidoreductase [Salipaludibacillus aurantiacus]SES18239.1 Glycine/D-amino acid oxidase [Salipaludibacillus aurantiacus]